MRAWRPSTADWGGLMIGVDISEPNTPPSGDGEGAAPSSLPSAAAVLERACQVADRCARCSATLSRLGVEDHRARPGPASAETATEDVGGSRWTISSPSIGPLTAGNVLERLAGRPSRRSPEAEAHQVLLLEQVLVLGTPPSPRSCPRSLNGDSNAAVFCASFRRLATVAAQARHRRRALPLRAAGRGRGPERRQGPGRERGPSRGEGRPRPGPRGDHVVLGQAAVLAGALHGRRIDTVSRAPRGAPRSEGRGGLAPRRRGRRRRPGAGAAPAGGAGVGAAAGAAFARPRRSPRRLRQCRPP